MTMPAMDSQPAQFSAAVTNQQLSEAIGAMLLLHASCQAVIEVSITPSSSPWYPILDRQLGQAENLVVGWRQNGFLYFQQDILTEILSCGQAFLRAKPGLDGLFQQLENGFSASIQAQIVAALSALTQPVSGMISQMQAYEQKLEAFQQALEVPFAAMNQDIAAIQAQEAEIQQEIANINAQIASLQQQVSADRAAIAKAKSARTGGILETIFGILLAPVTGGASLILAGIGVGTIAEAEDKVKQLQSQISSSQSAIAGDQKQLTTDQQQVATLQGLAMSVQMALNDIGAIQTSLLALETSWGVLNGETQNATADVQKAENAAQAIVAKVWFDAACNEWTAIVSFAQQMLSNNAPEPNIVMIGS